MTMEKFDSDKYNNLTVKQYIEIKLKMIKEAKKNPINHMLGAVVYLETIQQMFEGDLQELLRHTKIDKESLK
jgi:hypothetical protein